ncbi:MAG: Mur ligase domain-containing protein, partial [Deltaproteobacteria bacterium]|nr:Mur ligase domain-containing protein [Deltaproteobacteria bacterium]
MVQGDLKSGPGFGRLGLSLAQIAAFLEVAPGLEDFSAPWESKVLAVTTDSRAGCPGDLFIALKGEHFDGHDFVSSALKAGVLAAVVNKDSPAASLDGPLIRVSDTLEALGQLALAVRRLVKPKLAAVTGSVGKTTVKEILKSIFTCS